MFCILLRLRFESLGWVFICSAFLFISVRCYIYCTYVCIYGYLIYTMYCCSWTIDFSSYFLSLHLNFTYQNRKTFSLAHFFTPRHITSVGTCLVGWLVGHSGGRQVSFCSWAAIPHAADVVSAAALWSGSDTRCGFWPGLRVKKKTPYSRDHMFCKPFLFCFGFPSASCFLCLFLEACDFVILSFQWLLVTKHLQSGAVPFAFASGLLVGKLSHGVFSLRREDGDSTH